MAIGAPLVGAVGSGVLVTVRPLQRRGVGATASAVSGCHPVLVRVYQSRGITQNAELSLGLEGLLPISSLDGMESGVALLETHMRANSFVLVVGDFDADGATASALVVRALRRFGHAHVDFLVPDRFRFGYGLTPEIVALVASSERLPQLIITVDNGVSSHDGVAAARALGIDVLVTDHHLPADTLPQANAIVNPNLVNAQFGSRALAGVGVAFYLMLALGKRLGVANALTAELLDLVALGTVADVVPLDRNNRILVQAGLQRIRKGACVPGISALLQLASRRQSDVVASDLGFAIGPRLNAAGRIENMKIGIECLLADDSETAFALAQELDRINRDRRAIESDMQTDALSLVERLRATATEGQLPAALCLYDEAWHMGVVGLVASRVKEQVHRVVIAFAPAEDGLARGSARSVPGIHVRDALEAIATRTPGLIEKFGGHAMAAGLTIRVSRLKEFANALAKEVEARAEPGMLDGILYSDGTLAVNELGLELAEALRAGGPWGSGFPEPSFDGEFTVVEMRVLAEKHLKLWVRPAKDALPQEAIAFGWMARPGAQAPRVGASLRLLYRLDVNEYQGVRRAQLLIDHLEEVI